MNAAAAHAAFVMNVSAVRMYWLLRHAQHVSSIHFPNKSRLGQLCRFSAQWIWLHGNSCVRVPSMTDFCRFQSKFFRTNTARSEENQVTISITKIGIVESVIVFVPC